MLELGEDLLDGIEVGGVLGHFTYIKVIGWGWFYLEQEPGAGLADGLSHGLGLVRAEVVHDDDVAGLEGWDQHVLHIDAAAPQKRSPLINPRPVDEPGRIDSVVAQRGEEGRGVPAAMWRLADQSRARGRFDPQPRRGAMLVLVQVSSMNTRRVGSTRSRYFNH